MMNTSRQGIVIALLAMTLGCGRGSPTGPTPTPVAPAPAAASGTYTVTAGPTVVAPGGLLTVNWTGPSGRGCNGGGDWIAIFRVGDPDITGAANGHSDLWFVHVCGATSGTST